VITTLPSAPVIKRPVYIDTIEAVSEPLSKMTSISALVQLLVMTYQVRVPAFSSRDRLYTLMHTMAAVTPLPLAARACTLEDFRNSFIRLLSPVLNGLAGLYEFADAVDQFASPEDFRDFWTLQGRDLLREFVMDGCNGGAIEGMDVPFLDTFIQNQDYRVALGRRKGILALVPENTKAGDRLVLAAGAQEIQVFGKKDGWFSPFGQAYIQFV
jgi:hypothetical protein